MSDSAGNGGNAPGTENLDEVLANARDSYEALQVIRPEDLRTVRIGQRDVLVYMPAQWSDPAAVSRLLEPFMMPTHLVGDQRDPTPSNNHDVAMDLGGAAMEGARPHLSVLPVAGAVPDDAAQAVTEGIHGINLGGPGGTGTPAA